MPGPRPLGSLPSTEVHHETAQPARSPAQRRAVTVWGVAAIVAFAIALILRLAEGHIDAGVILTWQTFTIIGLLCLAVHVTAPWPWRRAA